MKVLVVGGAGYLGGAVTDILINSEHDLRVYDALLYEEEYRKGVKFIYGDIRNHEKLLPHLKWAEAVIWLAALVGDGACALNPEISTKINTDEVEWLSKNFDGRIIFMSTCSVYGAQDGELDENAPLNPLSVYAKTKLEAEKFLVDKNAIIFRLGTLFGVSDEYSRVRLDLVVNTMTMRAFYDKELKVFGGKQYRPLLHVKDAAKTACDNLTTTKRGIFNLRKININMIELAEKVEKHFPDIKIEKVEMKFEDARNYRVKVDKATKELKFAPKYEIEDGIKELKAVFAEGRIRDFLSPRFTNEMYLSKFSTHKLEKIPNGQEPEEPRLIEGGAAKDLRGKVSFINGFDFEGVKRFYMVENSCAGLVRAWHGHKHEAKYLMVLRGEALIGAVAIDNWDEPSKEAKVHRFQLSAQKPSVLYIPEGYANGLMSLTSDAQIMIFSNKTVEESKNDDFRFDPRYFDLPIYEDAIK
ncbi:MAG: NAD-dependent epimerase/dehydratase family protein [Patescibacteria group bacterium]|nr:NAD-dependent epimerase/dehydratase family protein [Patescibacteria group bacterium]